MSRLHFFSKMKTFVGNSSRAFAIIAAICILVMVFATCADIIGRDFFDKPITGVMELNQLLLTTTVFLGLAYTQHLRAHVRIEALVSRFPVRTQQVLDLLLLFFNLVIFSIVLWGASEEVVSSWKKMEYEFGAAAFPLYPAKTVLPLGILLYCLMVVTQITQRIGELRRHAPMEGAPSYTEAPAIE